MARFIEMNQVKSEKLKVKSLSHEELKELAIDKTDKEWVQKAE
jgi:hypothetical protein